MRLVRIRAKSWSKDIWSESPSLGVPCQSLAEDLLRGAGSDFRVLSRRSETAGFCNWRRKMVVLSHDADDSSLSALIEAAHEAGHAALGPWFAPGHPAAAALLAAGAVLACAGGYLHQPLAALPGIATSILLPLGNLMSEVRATAFALLSLRSRFPDRSILALIERCQKTERVYLLLETAGWTALLVGTFVLAYSVGQVFAELLA